MKTNTMTIPVALTKDEMNDLYYYLHRRVLESSANGDFIPDSLYSILGHLSVVHFGIVRESVESCKIKED